MESMVGPVLNQLLDQYGINCLFNSEKGKQTLPVLMATAGTETELRETRNVRPRLQAGAAVVVSPQQSFVERWRPRVQAQFVVLYTDESEVTVMPYATEAMDTVIHVLSNMILLAAAEADHHGYVPQSVKAQVVLSVPALDVESRRETMEVLYDVNDAAKWNFFARTRRADEATFPLLWTRLTGPDDFLLAAANGVLSRLQEQSTDLLNEIWARRQEAARVLSDHLPSDVVQFELAPYISYVRTRTDAHRPPRRRLSSTAVRTR